MDNVNSAQEEHWPGKQKEYSKIRIENPYISYINTPLNIPSNQWLPPKPIKDDHQYQSQLQISTSNPHTVVESKVEQKPQTPSWMTTKTSFKHQSYVIRTKNLLKKPSKPTKTPIVVPNILFPQMRPNKHPKNTYSNTFGFNH